MIRSHGGVNSKKADFKFSHNPLTIHCQIDVIFVCISVICFSLPWLLFCANIQPHRVLIEIRKYGQEKYKISECYIYI